MSLLRRALGDPGAHHEDCGGKHPGKSLLSLRVAEFSGPFPPALSCSEHPRLMPLNDLCPRGWPRMAPSPSTACEPCTLMVALKSRLRSGLRPKGDLGCQPGLSPGRLSRGLRSHTGSGRDRSGTSSQLGGFSSSSEPAGGKGGGPRLGPRMFLPFFPCSDAAALGLGGCGQPWVYLLSFPSSVA